MTSVSRRVTTGSSTQKNMNDFLGGIDDSVPIERLSSVVPAWTPWVAGRNALWVIENSRPKPNLGRMKTIRWQKQSRMILLNRARKKKHSKKKKSGKGRSKGRSRGRSKGRGRSRGKGRRRVSKKRSKKGQTSSH